MFPFDSVSINLCRRKKINFLIYSKVLGPTSQISSKYEPKFELAYVVTLAEHQLSTDLHVHNPSESSSDLEYQALFHNYIRVPTSSVRITPLQNLGYYDKTQPTDEGKALRRVETRTEVDVNKFTDFVYEDAPGNYQVNWPGGGIGIRTKNLSNVVVWNPHEEGKKIADMEERGWWVRLRQLYMSYQTEFYLRDPGRSLSVWNPALLEASLRSALERSGSVNKLSLLLNSRVE